MSDTDPIQSVSKSSSIDAQKMKMQRMKAMQRGQLQAAQQVNVKKEMTERCELAMFNPLAMSKRFEVLEKRLRRDPVATDTQESEESEDTKEIEGAQKIAELYVRKNRELKEQVLLSIKGQIHESDTVDDILEKVLSAYPDQFLADDALDFLIETTDPHAKLGQKLLRSKDRLHELYGKEVRAGRNINPHAQDYSKVGLGSPTNLRDLYRDIIGNPREPLQLFEELIRSFPFEKMKEVIAFVLHSVTADMKAKGPSIDPVELGRLFSEARSMQGILGVYRFFVERMGSIMKRFEHEGLYYPKRVTYQELAKYLVQLLAEKYPSVEKVLALAAHLGVNEELIAQTILFSQYRDAMRLISPRLFRNEKHRQELLMTLTEALEEIDDMLDEEEEEDA